MVGLLGLALIGEAAAQGRAYYSAGRTHIPAPHVDGTWIVEVTGETTFEATKRYQVPVPAGQAQQVKVPALIPKSAARTFMGYAARALPAAGGAAAAGMLLYDLFDDYRVEPDGQGGLVHDPGTEQVEGTELRWFVQDLSPADPRHGPIYQSPGAACDVMFEEPHVIYLCSADLTAPGATCGCGRANGQGQSYGVESRYTQVSTCPQSVDPFDPQNTIPAGSPPGPDGKCPTARYNHGPISPEAAAGLLEANPPPAAAEKDALQDALGVRPEGLPSESTGTPSEAVPVPGPKQTTTHPGGGTTTRDTTYTPTPTPGGIDWEKRETVTVRDAGGQVVSVEEIVTEGPSAAEGTPDPCEKDPDRLGCLKLGEVPSDAVPKASRMLSFQEESIGLPSGCPADHVIPDVGTVSYALACQSATDLRPWVIGLATMTALGLVLAALRQL